MQTEIQIASSSLRFGASEVPPYKNPLIGERGDNIPDYKTPMTRRELKLNSWTITCCLLAVFEMAENAQVTP